MRPPRFPAESPCLPSRPGQLRLPAPGPVPRHAQHPECRRADPVRQVSRKAPRARRTGRSAPRELPAVPQAGTARSPGVRCAWTTSRPRARAAIAGSPARAQFRGTATAIPARSRARRAYIPRRLRSEAPRVRHIRASAAILCAALARQCRTRESRRRMPTRQRRAPPFREAPSGQERPIRPTWVR